MELSYGKHAKSTKEEFDHEVRLEKAFFWNVVSQFDFLTEASA